MLVCAHNYGAKAEAYVPTPYVPYASVSYSHTILDGKNGLSNDQGDRFALEVGAFTSKLLVLLVIQRC
jgi:hypothetical protein